MAHLISELSSHPIDGMEIWNNEETKDKEKKNNLTLIDKEVLNICLKKPDPGETVIVGACVRWSTYTILTTPGSVCSILYSYFFRSTLVQLFTAV